MPTNLPAEYYKVEERYKAAESLYEKIATLEEMISTIPKHKGTDKLRADLRRRLSKLKDSAQSSKGGARMASLYHIDKEGAGQAVIVGPPNVGKSALVEALTNASPEVAPYPFTTQQPTPGMLQIENVQVQLIDTPPLSEEYVDPEHMSLIRRADLILLVVDLQAFPMEQLEQTLELLKEHKILPERERENYDDQRRLKFVKTLVLVNKTDDDVAYEDYEVLCELLGEETCPLIPVSATTGRGAEGMQQDIIKALEIIRVYSRPPGEEENRDKPFVLKQGDTVEDFAGQVHKDFVTGLKSARIWGTDVYDGQQVGRDHVLHDGDVVELRL